MAKCDPPFAQIVWGKLQRYLVTCDDFNAMLAHLPSAVRDQIMAVVKHALAAIVHKSQFHARSIGPRRGAGSNGKELPERGASLFDSDPDLTRDVARGGLVGVRKSANRVVGLRARRRMILKANDSPPARCA